MLFRCAGCGRLNRVARDGAKCGACHAPIDGTNKPQLVDDDALDRLVASSPVPVLVDFYADWCGPCRALAPRLAELAARHAGSLLVVKVDTERHQRTASSLGVSGIPALFLYKDGRLVGNLAGLQPPAALEEFVARAA